MVRLDFIKVSSSEPKNVHNFGLSWNFLVKLFLPESLLNKFLIFEKYFDFLKTYIEIKVIKKCVTCPRNAPNFVHVHLSFYNLPERI